jgi:hypothetical protein
VSIKSFSCFADLRMSRGFGVADRLQEVHRQTIPRFRRVFGPFSLLLLTRDGNPGVDGRHIRVSQILAKCFLSCFLARRLVGSIALLRRRC